MYFLEFIWSATCLYDLFPYNIPILKQMKDVFRKQTQTIYSSNQNSNTVISVIPSGYSASLFIGKSNILSV